MVDEAGAIGRERERGGRDAREARGFDLVAVRGEGLEPVPQPDERAHLVAEPQRLRVDALGQLRDDRLPDVVVRAARRRSVAGDRVQPELENHRVVVASPASVGRLVADEPGLRTVHVAVDGRSEMLVEREHQLG